MPISQALFAYANGSGSRFKAVFFMDHQAHRVAFEVVGKSAAT